MDFSGRKKTHCDYAGCLREGLYRAPKRADCSHEYYWFCLDHVRHYNAKWNYGKDWTPEQIEDRIRRDALWERQPRPLGGRIQHEERLRRSACGFRRGEAPVQTSAQTSARPEEEGKPLPPHLPHEVREAFVLFRLSYSPDKQILRKRYLALVKAYHPDGKNGDIRLEEKLKRVTHAYTLLKKVIDSLGE